MKTRTCVMLALAVLLPVGSGPALAAANAPAPPAVSVEVVAASGLGSLSGLYLAARHAHLNNDLEAAAAFYSSAFDRDPQNEDLLDTSLLMNVASGNIDRAAEQSRALLESDPENQVALIALAVSQVRDGANAEAIRTITTLQNLGGPLQELVGLLVKAWALTADGHAAQAISMLDGVRGPSWFPAFTRLHAGLIADHARLFHVGAERLRAAYERDPAAIRVVDAYARLLARSGEAARALAVLDAFETRLGGNDHFTKALRAEIESAQDVAPQIETPREGVAEALYGIGTAVGRDGSDTFAASLLQLALYLAPDSYYPAMALGQVLETMRQHEAAIAVYRAVPQSSPMRRNAQVQEALNLNVLDRHEEAIEILQQLVRDEPTDVGTAVALGNVLRSQERFAEAAEVYTISIDAFEEVPQAFWSLYYYRGVARERIGQWSAAEHDFRRALELEPEEPSVLNYLGYSYIDRGENLEEALDMVRRAVAARPEDGYIVDSLGWAYYRLGRYEDAVRELERAVNLMPSDPVINDHLGDAYWRVGRRLEAMFQWSHARDSNPTEEALIEITRKLAGGLPDEEPVRAANSLGAAPPAQAETVASEAAVEDDGPEGDAQDAPASDQ